MFLSLVLIASFISICCGGVCLPSHHVQFEGDDICYFIAETPVGYIFDKAAGGGPASDVLNDKTCKSHFATATTFVYDNSVEAKAFLRRLHNPTNIHYPMMLNTGYWVKLPADKCGVVKSVVYQGSLELKLCGSDCDKCVGDHFTLCMYEAKV